MRTGLFQVFLSLLLIAGLQTVVSAQATATFEIEAEILAIVNEYRSSKGLQPFVSSDYVSKVAREHSSAMARKATPYGHKGSNLRAKKIKQEIVCGLVGENAAVGQQNAREVVNAWIKSRGHRENILERQFTLTGIGVAKNKRGQLYFTQIFVSQ